MNLPNNPTQGLLLFSLICKPGHQKSETQRNVLKVTERERERETPHCIPSTQPNARIITLNPFSGLTLVMRLLRWPLGFCPSLTYVFFTHPSELISLKTNLSHVPAKNCSVVSPYMENTTPSPFLRPPSLSLAATSHLLPGLHGPTPPTFLQALAHSEQLPISGPLPVLFHLHGTLFPFLSQLESYPYFLFWRCVYWSGT